MLFKWFNRTKISQIGCLTKTGQNQHLKLSPQSYTLFYKALIDKEHGKPPTSKARQTRQRSPRTLWIVHKGVPASPFLRHYHLTLLAPLFKICFPCPLFWQPPSLHPHAIPSCPNPTNQPTFLGLNIYQKGDFTSLAVTFYQKSVFNLLNPFTSRLS